MPIRRPAVPVPSPVVFAAVLAVLTVLTSAAPGLAQQGAETFNESIDVNVVNVEVVVTDKQGVPVRGLTRDDFEIFEDGERMVLTNFYAVEEPEIQLGEGQMPEPQAADAAPERPLGVTQRLNMVIFVDNLNTRPENRKQLFENLREKLRTDALPGSQVMVAAMNRRVEVIEPFTTDLARVHAALDELEKQTSVQALVDGGRRMFLSKLARSDVQDFPCNARPAPPPPPSSGGTGGTGGGSGGGGFRSSGLAGGNRAFVHALKDAQLLAQEVQSIGEQRYQNGRSAIFAMQFFSDTLGGLPGRKALIYLSDGIPMRPAEALSEAWIAKYGLWVQQHGDCLGDQFAASDLRRASTGSGIHHLDLHSDFNRLTEQASDNRVVIYPISNHGRGVGLVSAEVPGSTDGASGTMIRSAMITEAQSRAQSLLQMAEDTGGLALTSTANVGELIDRMSRDFATFYSLGYRAPEAERDAAYHEIKVKVRRDGVKVRHVDGRRDKTWVDRLGDMTAAAALFGLESNPLGIALERGEPVRQGKRFKVPILVQIPLDRIQMVSDGNEYSADLALLVVVKDSKDGFSKPRRFDLPIRIPNAQILQARQQAAAYPLELEMKKNAEVVAVSVRDNYAQTASCLTLDYDFGGKKGTKKWEKAAL